MPFVIGHSQYESLLTTSPPATVPRARQIIPLIVLFMNRTDPIAEQRVDAAFVIAAGVERRKRWPAVP
jgi:hypothetical protein